MRRLFVVAASGLAVACSLAVLVAADNPNPNMGTTTETRTGTAHNQAAGMLSKNEMIMESAKLTDLKVHNDQSTSLGSIDNLIIDAHTGQVLYGLLDTGVGGKHVPVPWAALRLAKGTSDNDYSFILNVSKDQLANAPSYDSRNRPDFANQQWKQSVDRFFGVRTVARPMQSD
jgi:hypothetical protein